MHHPNLIGGEWVTDSGTILEDRNPARPDEVVATFPLATRKDARSAIAAARNSLASWARTPASIRGELLDRVSHLLLEQRDGIARAISLDMGKTLSEARAEVEFASTIFRCYSGEAWRSGGSVLQPMKADQHLYSRREPLGVVSMITPYNYPVSIPALKLAPALAHGNAVVFKPSSLTPFSSYMLVRILVDAGIPPGVVNFLTGRSEVGDEMVVNPDVDGVSFTGSVETGKTIYRRAIDHHMVRVQLELGGKNAMIVLADGDIEKALRFAISGGFGVSGQVCTATSRVIVEEPIADSFCEALAERIAALRVGNGLDDAIQMGPLVSQERCEQVCSYIDTAQREGAHLVVGGTTGNGNGYFVMPTLFDHVEAQSTIARNEIFGPVVSLLRASGFDDAIQKANAVEYGLTASIVTRDTGQGNAVRRDNRSRCSQNQSLDIGNRTSRAVWRIQELEREHFQRTGWGGRVLYAD